MRTTTHRVALIGLLSSACYDGLLDVVDAEVDDGADAGAQTSIDPSTGSSTGAVDDTGGGDGDLDGAGTGSSGAGGDEGTTGAPPTGATPENLRVAFFGDNGLGGESVETLQLVIAEDADMLVVLGDFDYDNDPTAWHEQIDEALGADFPLFAAAGNHDVSAWDGYREVLMERLAPIVDADCDGPIGEQMHCRVQGIDLFLSSVGTMDPPGDQSHEDWLAEGLAASPQIWRFCAWHKNQNDMQAGGKGNEVGWEAYRNCMNGGAIIATGHEHSYARTQTLTDLGNPESGHGAKGEHHVMTVGTGSTFVFVSGLGGNEVRDYEEDLHDDDTWWST
ncbi:MAG TPA: metallophosphoesterase, partial [Nannocystaceae bacterium]|nr:metallophosphoesterase [Nannocystaceae bacterium]